MSLTRWRPFHDLNSELNWMRQEMDRLFGQRDSREGLSFSPTGFPPINVWEESDTLFVEAELPGMELQDLEISLTRGNELTVKGERKPLVTESGVCHRCERGYGSFTRVIELPYFVDAEGVDAMLKHGVLTIKLPKSEAAKPRRIELKSN